MRRLVFLLMFCAGCASSHQVAQSDEPQSAVRIAGGNGARCDIAIQIFAPTQRIGVQAEHDWLQEHRAGYRVVRKVQIDCSGVPTHRFTIVMPDGRQEDVFFDTSDFVGKL